MSRYRSASGGDAALAAAKPAESKPAEAKPAETKPAETKPAETKPAETKPAETKPAEAGHLSASNAAACCDPAEFQLRGAYSIDGMTAVAPAHFPEPGLLKRLCDAAAAGERHESSEPGATRQDGGSQSDDPETQNLDMSDAEVC